MRATGTITPRSRADIRSSSATRRTGRRWATGAWPGINRRRSGSTTGPVRSWTLRRLWVRPIVTTAARWHSPISAGVAPSTSWWRTSEALCCCIRTRCRRNASGSRSSWRVGAARTPPRSRAATAARSARRWSSSGTGGSSSRKCPAAPVSAHRISGDCISAWARNRQVDRAVIRWPSGKTQELKAPAAGRVHRIQEPA